MQNVVLAKLNAHKVKGQCANVVSISVSLKIMTMMQWHTHEAHVLIHLDEFIVFSGFWFPETMTSVSPTVLVNLLSLHL